MRYEHYRPEDFIKDDDFVQWVKNPSDASATFWEKWLLQHPEKAQTVAAAREIILSVRYKNHFEASEADLKSVWKNIQAAKQFSAPMQQERPLWPSFIRAAAAIVILSIAALLAWQYTSRTPGVARQGGTGMASLIEFKTAKGEKNRITLPDGSQVRLNADSRIAYRSDFGTGGRDVTLEGEAFFEVTSDKARPFRIQTGRLTTTVVGTSFNINAYADNPQIKVAVATGVVEVASELKTRNESMVRLRPEQMSVFTKDNRELTIKAFDPKLEMAWVTDKIALKNAGFEEIRRVLERQYAVTFVVEKGLQVKEDFNATFENVPIKKVLDALNYTSEFQYKLVKDKVYVTKKKS
nr:FecR family protein [uncultured Dyadobacter sp.]